jgi:tetratricopeptide (TPR) repeat protein
MAETHPIPIDQGRVSPAKLSSWKEIAAYLGREVRTVQRWEKLDGMPVRRLFHEKRGSVYALAAELDAWVASRDPELPVGGTAFGKPRAHWAAYPFAMAAAICALAVLLVFFARPSGRPPSTNRADSNPPSLSPVARAAYLRGMYYFNRGTASDLEASIGYFKKATVADPACATAYARLSEAYLYLGIGAKDSDAHLRLAETAAHLALDLNGALAEAHEALAEVQAYSYWDWKGAGAEFQRALQLNPNLASAHSSYAQLEGLLGQSEIAISEAKRARELEPLSALLGADLAWYYYWARRFDEAIAVSREMLQSEPRFASAQSCIVRSLVAQRKFDEARIELVRQIGEGDGGAKAALGAASAEQAIRGYYAWNVGRLEAIEKRQDIPLFDMALDLAFLRRTDDLMACLEKALQLHQGIVLVMNVEPFFAPYRQEPRFVRIAEKVGLILGSEARKQSVAAGGPRPGE